MSELQDIDGVGPSTADKLHDEGFTSPQEVADAEPYEIEEAVNRIDLGQAEDFVEHSQDIVRDEMLDEQTNDDDVVEAEDTEETDESEDTDDSDDEGAEAETESEMDRRVEEGTDTPHREGEDDATGSDSFDLSVGDTDVDGNENVELAEEDEEEYEEPYDVSLDISNNQFDYIISALVTLKVNRRLTMRGSYNAANSLLDEIRPLGGEGTASLEMDQNELNSLHSALVEAENLYSNGSPDAFSAVRELKNQVQAYRSKYLF